MLARIIESKRQAIIARTRDSFEAERAALELRAAAQSPGGFAESLRAPGTRVIAEVKRKSPSAGVIASGPVDIVAQATAYRDGGAAAISVLTDNPFFGGSLEDLAAIAAAVPGVPLLRKDFLLDEFDLLQSRAYGADAVLLIARILDDERLAALIAEAARLDLAALVEVHDEDEVARAVAAGATIIGVNNRDLDDFTIDLQRTARLAPAVPRGLVLVAESGIETGAHVRELRDAGVTRMLVGSALMRAERPDELLFELIEAGGDMRSPLVKLCGMRTLEDVRAAAVAGATHVGVLLAEGFRRSVSVDTAASLSRLARSLGVVSVGVTTSTDVDEINRLCDESGVELVQLSALAAHTLAVEQLHCEAVVVVHVGEHDTHESLVARVAELSLRDNVAALLFDTSDSARDGGSGREGGTGLAFNHELVAEITAPVPVFIAGGVTPATARATLQVTGADGIDVASGIETAGHPDPARMLALVQAVTGSADSHDWYADEHGRFSTGFGGSYIPETLVPAVKNLTRAWEESKTDTAFQAELRDLLTTYVGRPTPLTFAQRLTRHAGGARIYLKREDLCHTGAHKINNALGQTLLAKRMGLTRVIAETGAGQHGVATATACALLGLECIVYMGEEDIVRQQPNVFRMQLLGATVVPVTDGTRTLKDAVNAAIRDWVANVHDTFYVIGSVVGMHPFPSMVRDFQRVIGDEVRVQLAEAEVERIDAIVACVGGGSNAIGIFHPFLDDAHVRLIGAEAGGEGVVTGRHAAPIVGGSPGVLHGMQTYLMQTDDGQIVGTHSISAGLDYPGVGPEHAHLAATGRAEYVAVNDEAALNAVQVLCRTEGIIPALESAHAIALGIEVAAKLPADRAIVINLSGRGDKDLATMIDRLASATVSEQS